MICNYPDAYRKALELDEPDNNMYDRTAGSHALAAAGQRER